jgi:hypothetical protein
MVRAELFRQVSLDMADTSTEYGGSLEAVRSDASSGSSAEVPVFEARLYEPRERRGDMRFIPSDQMVTSTPRALTLYHFHCQDSHNGKYAGPGTGDLEFAASYGRNCIVFTCIEDGLLDVDYYQRNGARIDLGELKEKGNRD